MILGIAILFSFLNLFHVFYYLSKVPPNTIFIGITHWYEDYFFYLSQMTQGAMGQWSLINKYSLENIPIGFNWVFNLLLGKLSNSPVWTTYDITIFILTFIYILLMYKVLTSLFTNKIKAYSALIVALTSTNWFFNPVTYFYAYTSALNRLGGVAHHVAQNILSLVSVYLFAKLLESYKLKTAIIIALTLSILFLMSSFYVMINIIVFVVSAVLLKNRKIVKSFLIIIAPLAVLAYFQSQVISHPFWVLVREWEQTRSPATFSTFIISGGLIMFLVPFGLTKFLKIKSPLRVVGLMFAILPIVLYFSGIAGIPVFRLLQPAGYVFLAAIATEALAGKKRIFLLLVSIYVLLQIPGLGMEIKSRVNEYYLNSHLNFLDRDVYDGLLFLKDQPHDKNVLAVHTLESFVPVVSGHSVFEGHATLTLDYKEKIDKTIAFYTNKMSEIDAYTLLKNNNIDYILWEKRFGEAPRYSFFRLLYENPKLVIFTL